MEKINDGGPAEVISLRDFFAGKALMGLSARSFDVDEIAERCYEFADAMIKARG